MRMLALVAAFSSGAGPALAHHAMGGVTPASFLDGLLSGLSHPVIGLDHLAAVIAVGCLAAGQRHGAVLAIGYVIAMIIGAAAHIGEATVAGAGIFVAFSVIALGLVLLRAQALRTDIAFALFAFAGLVNGYALGESIAGAESKPIYGYFIGLVLVQSGIALLAMAAVPVLTARKPSVGRVIGGVVAGIGLGVLAAQVVAAT
ncbi:MAG TPA: HupE/UreJ family protein [Xanthobacteraceae bacterium]|nr:HupE/UreJ family protein [Xanthobacteraceae bacterium]